MIMLSFMGFLQSCLLIVNSFAILNERFLNKIGWGVKSDLDMNSFKGKIITLLHSLRFFFRSMFSNI
ncbi:hypothetical protein DDB_G0279479 [Dictyostelium discoideum AX4]|uniref:Protein transport protein yos1 n=1 Tax=Dictyostelium discoideum TaxID=44689 RepID=YOS1_DICDI|nr:hypothetical protein DDB_G0279479 [Dictyostelium discoideum AX4]Q54WR6.1 RecName: Full=Protein transport protein yos1 [Dictyostelium discoideum]EAL67678.1 hypothetical protein DDB_G0279479 [Dictyostelium discoideum AX4]|eukprot:XP_641651.1 hypothetical protein DDB_G0279479 [Dictyostelium discoideum AX4]